MSDKKVYYGHGYDESNSIAIIWTIEDVRQVIGNYGNLEFLNDVMSDDDCLDILGIIESNHDANYGISWDTIFYTLHDEYADEIKENEEKDEV
jgi:hypothetical protein